MDPSVAPAEYRQKGYVLEFNDNGDVKPKTALPDYTVYSFDHESDPPVLNTLFSCAVLLRCGGKGLGAGGTRKGRGVKSEVGRSRKAEMFVKD